MIRHRVIVGRIGAEVAFPFVRAYCQRWGIPLSNDDAAQDVTWWGAFYHRTVRAVMGFTELDDGDLFLYGMYGDGSPHELRAISKLVDCVDMLPNTIHGTIHLPNLRMYRAAGKRGWEITKMLPQQQAAVVTRPGRPF